jgi:uncharacterized membrane protein
MDDPKETGRVEAFSDGVFAVAITLLILDIQTPDTSLSITNDDALRTYLLDQWPMLLAFLTSFATIGVMWINHHKMFTRIKYINNPLLLLNLLLLAVIVFIPYPTALVAEQYTVNPTGRLAAVVYSGTMVILATCFNLLWRYASYHNRLLRKDTDPQDVAGISRQYIYGPFIYLLAFGLAWINVPASILLDLLLAISFALPHRSARPSKPTIS